MQFLKQSTNVTIRIGPFLDDTDGKSPETGLSVTQSTVRLSKGFAAAAQKNESTTGTHDENGFYRVPLNTTDTNTLGSLRVSVNISGALPIWEDYTVLTANVYNSLIAGTDTLDVDASSLLSTTVEGSLTVLQSFRLWLAALCGKCTGSSTSNVKYRDTADTKNRINATLDGVGNRTNITLDAT